eukprot:6790425-Prymnesium_polylepis.1
MGPSGGGPYHPHAAVYVNDTTGMSRLHARNSQTSDTFRCAHCTLLTGPVQGSQLTVTRSGAKQNCVNAKKRGGLRENPI